MTILQRLVHPRLIPRASAGTASPPFTILFLHIPKTGGISFRQTLIDGTQPHPSFRIVHPLDDRERLSNLSAHDRSGLGLVEGHMYFGVHDLIPRPCAYVTLLRKPVDRIVSYYNFVRGWQPHHLHNHIVSGALGAGRGGMSLLECLHAKLTIELDNCMTRMLTSASNALLPFGAVDRDMLCEAKAHLDSMALVGLTERLQETVDRASALFGWPATAAERLNVGTARTQELDKATHDLIVEHNALDMELYAYACDLFERRAAK